MRKNSLIIGVILIITAIVGSYKLNDDIKIKDPFEFITVHFSGPEGQGSAWVEVMEEVIIDGYSEDRSKEIMSDVFYEVLNNGRLSEGDTVTVKAVSYPKEGSQNKIKLGIDSKEFKVQGLGAPSEIDLFDKELKSPLLKKHLKDPIYELNSIIAKSIIDEGKENSTEDMLIVHYLTKTESETFLNVAYTNKNSKEVVNNKFVLYLKGGDVIFDKSSPIQEKFKSEVVLSTKEELKAFIENKHKDIRFI